ncbi:MAG: hypothetical protein VKI81_00045 [Synechococcaceae cyanobacterium]|nr:hypothetical protein [Synechococcaceae cyanobacterium]
MRLAASLGLLLGLLHGVVTLEQRAGAVSLASPWGAPESPSPWSPFPY